MAVSTVTALINGVTTTLTLNAQTGKYEATITAPSTSSFTKEGGYYPISVTATDVAGNSVTKNDTDSTLGDSLKLYVKETTAPVITITAPTAGSYTTSNKPKITWSISDNDSGVNGDTIKIKIDSGSATGTGITKTASGKGYTCEYTPSTALTDGSHTVTITASDNDGNAAIAKSVTFTVDTVPPTLSVTAPTENLITNVATCTVTGTTNDVTSSPVTLTVKLNSGAAQNVSVAGNGSFSKTLTLVAGTNTITVTAKDAAGKTTTVTRTVVLDQTPPTIVSVTLSKNPVNTGTTYVISVEVTDN